MKHKVVRVDLLRRRIDGLVPIDWSNLSGADGASHAL